MQAFVLQNVRFFHLHFWAFSSNRAAIYVLKRAIYGYPPRDVYNSYAVIRNKCYLQSARVTYSTGADIPYIVLKSKTAINLTL